MNKHLLAPNLFLWSLLFHQCLSAQTVSSLVAHSTRQSEIQNTQAMIDRANKAQAIDDLIQTLYDENQFNGTILIIEKGEVIYQKALGWANYAKKDTLTMDTPFRLASVSKQFTAMAIMLLYEQGKLHFDDPITKYLPELPYSNVSIRNLLQHNSGIPDYFGIGWSIQRFFSTGKLINNQDLLNYFSVKKPVLKFKPGTKASYSNTAYAFLASIVERVSNEEFSFFLGKHIFLPLQMHNTFLYNTKNYEVKVQQDTTLVRCDTLQATQDEIKIDTYYKITTHLKTVERTRAFGYQLSYPYPAGYAALDYHEFDGIAGEKGICASATDLVKWDKALHEYRLVSQQTQEEAYKMSPIKDKKEYGYGFGWKVYTHDPRIVFHHGLYRGFRTYFQRNLDDKSTVIILSNRTLGGKVTQIHYAIQDIMANAKYKVPKPTKIEKNTYYEFKKNYWIDYKN